MNNANCDSFRRWKFFGKNVNVLPILYVFILKSCALLRIKKLLTKQLDNDCFVVKCKTKIRLTEHYNNGFYKTIRLNINLITERC